MFFRCTSLRSKYSSCQQLNNSTKENFILPPEQGPGNGTKHEPLILPLLPKAYSSAVSGMSIHWTIQYIQTVEIYSYQPFPYLI